MKTIASLILVFVIGAVGLTLYKIRTAEHDPSLWHVDPLHAIAALTPNHYRLAPAEMTDQEVDEVAPVYTGDIHDIAQAFDKFVLTQRDTVKIAGSVEENWITYVQRTPRLKIPDYISVKFIPLELPGKVTIAVFSRSRYGNGDMGVNEARVKIWMSSLEAFIE